jgi:hypothetical protein
MKKLYFVIFFTLSTILSYSQAPQKFSYQAVIRNSVDELLTNAQIGVQLSLVQGSVSGTSVYVETHKAATNNNGLLSISFGSGTAVQGNFSDVDWSSGPFFIRSEIDPDGGNSYTITTITQLLSVPYALYAEKSGTPGPAGPQGETGATGPQGPEGPEGAAGPQGLTGPQGPAGLRGATGEAGPKGPAGEKGEQGIAGPKGDQGPVGPQGLRGETGATGPAGQKGDQGLQGAQGLQGIQGPQGVAGKNALVRTTPESAGFNCSVGGLKIEAGLDGNNNGVLEVSEIDATLTRFVCNGATGAQGPAGTKGDQGVQGLQGIQGFQGPQGPMGIQGVAGKNTAVRTTAEAAGANCNTGGIKIEYGLDANSNGSLDNNEIEAALTRYICNGTTGAQGSAGAKGEPGVQGIQGIQGIQGLPGSNGKNALIKLTTVAISDNCPTGGTKIETGIDQNYDGVLDTDEINNGATRYVCNGATGPAGPTGATGPQGTQGIQGPAGVVSIFALSGFTPDVPPSQSAYLFVGNTSNVTLTSGQRITGSATAIMMSAGVGRGRVGLCYQNVNGGTVTVFSTDQTPPMDWFAGRSAYAASATATPAAGTYKVGYCILNMGNVPAREVSVSGWVMVTQ